MSLSFKDALHHIVTKDDVGPINDVDEAVTEAARKKSEAKLVELGKRHLLKQSHVVPDSENDEREELLSTIATKGVEQLFAAILETQKENEENCEDDKEIESSGPIDQTNVEDSVKKSFLDILRQPAASKIARQKSMGLRGK